MCGGGGAPSPPDNSKQLALQREQMDEQTRQFEIQRAEQQARYEEQKRIAEAPPPPAPNPTAEAPTPALEIAQAPSPTQRTAGYGRKRMRADIPGSAIGTSLGIVV